MVMSPQAPSTSAAYGDDAPTRTNNNNSSNSADDPPAEQQQQQQQQPPWPVLPRHHDGEGAQPPGRRRRSFFPTTTTTAAVGWIRLRNLYRQWSFSYMNPILARGQRQFRAGGGHHQPLGLDDLYRVPDEMRADRLVAQFWELYRPPEESSRNDNNNNNNNNSNAKKKNAHTPPPPPPPSLIATLLRLAAPALAPAGIWEFLYVVCRVTLPVSLHFLLRVIERQNDGNDSDDSDNVNVNNAANDDSSSESSSTGSSNNLLFRQGFVYALTLSAAAFWGTVSQNQAIFLSAKSGIMIRSALTVAIYRHALNLTPRGREGLTTGEITNLVAVDTQKLYDVMIEGHNLWSCPALACVVTVLLWLMVGPELMVGVAVLIVFLPLVQLLVQRMLRIRRERSKLTDQRINLLSAMLEGIRVTKLNHYESKVEENVGKVRDGEMALLRRELRMWAFVLSAAVISPLIAFGVASAFYVLNNNILDAADAFSALLLFSILRFPINMTARLVGKFAQALDSVKRISDFLDREVREPEEEAIRWNAASTADTPQLAVDLKNASFSIKPQTYLLDSVSDSRDTSVGFSHEPDAAKAGEMTTETTFTIQNISLRLNRSDLLACTGKIGSGKTMLLKALLGEVPALESTEQIDLNGRISYAAQQPFILNATFRENILFGSDFDKSRYEQAIDACCLRPDIEKLGAGELTQIGERGVTLSGGQKARLALARALYANPDIALLDDVFSALDATTAMNVFDALFGSESKGPGVLESSATILVTHSLNFLPRADQILVFAEGSARFRGTWSELRLMEKTSADSILDGIDYSINSGNGDGTKPKGDRPLHNLQSRNHHATDRDGIIMVEEEREYGIASLSVWVTWFREAGGWPYVLTQLVFMVVDRGLYVSSDAWIAFWSGNAYEGGHFGNGFGRGVYFPPQTEGLSAQAQYLTVYASLIALSTAATVLRSLWGLAGGARCANKMFQQMTSTTLRCPLSFFETVPLGRILNRFTYDVEVLDIELSIAMNGMMISSSWLLSSVVVMISVLPWVVFAVVPVCALYFGIQLYYRRSGPDLQRLDAMSRSPIQASLAEGLEGSTTIRAFKRGARFAEHFGENVNRNSSAMLCFFASQRWLGLRIEFLGSTMTLIVATVITCANQVLQIPAGLVGLLILWTIIFSTALNFFFLRLTESEARITSIERIQRTAELPRESYWNTEIPLDPEWPAKGELEFHQVCMRYRKGLPLALDSISFRLPPGTRAGIVGRTGSGKTSLVAATMRLVEIESGRIVLDGVDLAKIGLTDVRGRSNGIRAIPQDPVLFAGTVRDCIDPFGIQPDDRVLEALQAVDHRGARERGLEVLQDKVEQGGANYSVGERQLLCMARAIAENPRVIMLDEATASIDAATDNKIQSMLRLRFKDTTMLTIAHRLHTVMDYNVLIVMEEGRVVEFDRPRNLLANPEGTLSRFVDATGPESVVELRRIAGC